jgi:nucleoid DNA-binding protein
VIKNDIVSAVAKAAGLERQKTTQAVETIIDVLREALSCGGRIELRGFGVLLVTPRKRGFGRNPKRPTEVVQIPPGFTIKFRPGKELRNMTGPAGEPAAKAPHGPPVSVTLPPARSRALRPSSPSPPPSGEEVNDRHEKSRADDGPQDRERMPADDDHKRLWKLEQPSDPRPKKGTDEAKDYRDD